MAFVLISLTLWQFPVFFVSVDVWCSYPFYHLSLKLETVKTIEPVSAEFNAEVDVYYMAGNSMGGWLAWEYALDHPDEVKKLILIDAAGFITPDNPPKPLRLSQKFKKRTSKGAPRFAVRKFLKQAYGDKNKIWLRSGKEN